MPSVTSEAGQRQIRRTLSRKSLVGEGPITFDELMSHRSSLLYFKQFCVEDMSTEQLLFWLEVCDYQAVKSDDFRAFLARKLLRKYITPTSPNVLGLSSRHREEIIKEVSSGKGLAHAFDEAAAQVHFNLRYDVFPRFVQSEAYSSLVTIRLGDVTAARIEDFDLCRFLGAGGFGMVLLTRHRENGQNYAVKVIDKRIIISQNQMHAIFREKEVLASVEHPFIVALRYAFQTPDHLCLVLEYVSGAPPHPSTGLTPRLRHHVTRTSCWPQAATCTST